MQGQRTEPLAQPPESSQRASGEPLSGQLPDNPGILVVDDEHLVRMIMQLGLERQGFDVWLASHGQEAIDLYRQHRTRIDVVLLDVCMPGLDGPQTLDALHDLNPNVCVCFMSGNMGSYDLEELHRRGAACVLAKPFRLAELADILRRLASSGAGDLLKSGGGCQG